jgi:putative ABC transport system ATP-binding protein
LNSIFRTENVRFLNMLSYPDIEIPRKGMTFIKGPSGAGKSSLLKLLNASASPSSGEIYYEGKNLVELDTVELRREVILIGQNVYLFDESIEENFRLYYSYRDLSAPNEETMLYYLRLCQADFGLLKACVTLSGGERQRVYIAICLSFMPKVLLLDEPTSALDQDTARTLLRDLKKFAEEKEITMIVVSHDDTLAEEFSDHLVSITREVD